MNNDVLLDGIKNGDEDAFEKVYRTCFNLILSIVGDSNKARDYFHEVLIVLIEKYLRPQSNFNLTVPICNFLGSIVRKMKARDYRDVEKEKSREDNLINLAKNLDIELSLFNEDSKKVLLFRKAWQQLKPDCQEMLIAKYVHELTYKEIVSEIGHKSEVAARIKSYNCKKYLIKIYNKLNDSQK